MKKTFLAVLTGAGIISAFLIAQYRAGPATPGARQLAVGVPAGAPEAPPRTAKAKSPAAVASTLPDEAKFQILSEVLSSRNDNDPRLDHELRDLSPALKARFRMHYHSLPPEQRNERGTIVFLLGRNLAAPEDFAFLCEVLKEPPCLSLENCGAPAEEHVEGNPLDEFAHQGGDEVTRAYPQIVALRMLEKSSAPQSREGIECGLQSRVNLVRQRAGTLTSRSSKEP